MFNILIIEDDVVDRMAVRRALGQMAEPFELLEADTAEKGIELAVAGGIDCILLDYSLPDMDGLQVLKTLVNFETPVVILTGSDYESNAIDTLREGAQDFIQKNQLSPARLYQSIINSIERQEQLSARKKAEEETFRMGQIISESSSEVYIVDPLTLHFNMMSKGARRNLELVGSDLIDHSVLEVLSEYTEESFRALIKPLLEGELEEVRIETQLERSNGDCFEADVILQLSKAEASDLVVAYVTDMTERNAAADKLRQVQKLEALGMMIGGIAHDYNNLLTSIIGGLGLLERQPLSEKGQRFLQLAKGSAERTAELTTRLLTYSRKRVLTPKTVNVNVVVRELMPFINGAVDEDIEVSFVPHSSDIFLKVDQVELESSLLNICLNAKDAMPDGGKIKIVVGEDTLPRIAQNGLDNTDEKHVLIAITDTGKGMDGDTLQRAFDPFFTTKDVGKGSGLGLSMVYGFVTQSGGELLLESEVNKGTTVKLYMPHSVDEIEVMTEVPQDEAAPKHGAGEKILLVEDDEKIREFAIVALEEGGYKVVVAHDGPQAVQAMKTNKAFDVLLTDVVMPNDMSGLEVAEHFRKMFPGKPVIYTSGYTRNEILSSDTLPDGSTYLSKPYNLSLLYKTLAEALGG